LGFWSGIHVEILRRGDNMCFALGFWGNLFGTALLC
jgi:hypothetical protein